MRSYTATVYVKTKQKQILKNVATATFSPIVFKLVVTDILQYTVCLSVYATLNFLFGLAQSFLRTLQLTMSLFPCLRAPFFKEIMGVQLLKL